MSARILLVDDDPNILAGYRRALSRTFDVHTCDDPFAAVELLKEDDDFAVIVTDMKMPGMTGLQVLEHVQQLVPHAARIMLTGMIEDEIAQQIEESDLAFRILAKPCGREDLIQAIESGLAHHADRIKCS